MSNVNMEASAILPVLKKKLAFLSGGGHALMCARRFFFPPDCECLLSDRMFFPTGVWCVSGGKDRRSGLILNIPLSSDQTSMEELSATLDYLLSIPRYWKPIYTFYLLDLKNIYISSIYFTELVCPNMYTSYSKEGDDEQVLENCEFPFIKLLKFEGSSRTFQKSLTTQ